MLDRLRRDPTRRLGIDDDILNPDIRYTEIRYWLERQVMGRRG